MQEFIELLKKHRFVETSSESKFYGPAGLVARFGSDSVKIELCGRNIFECSQQESSRLHDFLSGVSAWTSYNDIVKPRRGENWVERLHGFQQRISGKIETNVKQAYESRN